MQTGNEAGKHHDVVIMGGGLAGLTLALQLKQRLPRLDILILERRRHPVPSAAHKVGESTVEIAAHYFGEVLGLTPYLQAKQLKKFGFRFFFSDGREDVDQVTELGASTFLPTPSYQLDRGLFENDLAGFAVERGCRFIDGAMIRQFTLAAGQGDETQDLHRVSYERDGSLHEVTARWVIDAAGRAGLIKRKLGLEEDNDHQVGAVWFRIGERIDINEWSSDPAWLARSDPPNRWLSTNHLVGEGYWAWLIPLASGAHSVGIVADPALHPIETINSFEKSMAWLRTRQPRLYRDLDARRDKLLDFAYFKRFSHGCKQVFSGRQRWALTGESGVFLDPFYSPGSDFIAIANTFITEMIALDQQKGPVQMIAGMYDQIYFSLYRNMLPIYLGQYPIFADAQVMPVKVIWDYTFYWGIMCPLFIQNRLIDLPKMGQLQPQLARIERLNVAVQLFLRAWSRLTGREHNPPQLLDQAALGWFAEMNRGLTDKLDGKQFDALMQDSGRVLDELAAEIVQQATARHPELDGSPVLALLPAGVIAGDRLFPDSLAETGETAGAGNAAMSIPAHG
jgi:flavin-dependent dehydrogenase